MTKITKAVIPCGGMGTRFLPITKAVPKEILPVIDTPVLGHIVKEAIDSGITDILIVLGNGKDAIRNYFIRNIELENKLIDSGKKEYAELLRTISEGAKITFAVQKEPKGSGDAVLYAEDFVKDEPFCLAWGDDLIYSETPVMGQLMDGFNQLNGIILGVQKYPGKDISKYGVCDVDKSAILPLKNMHKLKGIVEKPRYEDAPSDLAGLGRYILTPDIFRAIKGTKSGLNGELQLTDAICALCGEGKTYAYEFTGRRYDMGDKFGAITASIEYGLRNSEYSESLKEYLKNLASKL